MSWLSRFIEFLRGLFAGTRGTSPKPMGCIELWTMTPTTTGPNPLNLPPGAPTAQFIVWEAGGVPPPPVTLAANTRIQVQGPFTGLNCGFKLEISLLGGTARQVAVKLVHFAQPAKVEAFESNGSLAQSSVMTPTQNIAQLITLVGAALNKVVITPPSDETLLLEFCHLR